MKKTLITIVVLVVMIAGLLLLGKKNKQRVAETQTESRKLALMCTTDMATQYHIHPEIEIIINGEKQIIPTNIGVTQLCMNSVHTHDSSGVIHVEAPAPADFTLGDFFAVWKKDFSSTIIIDNIADDAHEVVVTVNGERVDTYENTILKDKDKIVISYQQK